MMLDRAVVSLASRELATGHPTKFALGNFVEGGKDQMKNIQGLISVHRAFPNTRVAAA